MTAPGTPNDVQYEYFKNIKRCNTMYDRVTRRTQYLRSYFHIINCESRSNPGQTSVRAYVRAAWLLPAPSAWLP